MPKYRPRFTQLQLFLSGAIPLASLYLALITYKAVVDGIDINQFFWAVSIFGNVPLLVICMSIGIWEMHQRDKRQKSMR